MTERAAHLVDSVLPSVPVRQWVLSVPVRVRYLIAYDANLCSLMVKIFTREVFRCIDVGEKITCIKRAWLRCVVAR